MKKIITIPKAVIIGIVILILGRYIKLPPTKLQLGKFAYQLKNNKIYLEMKNNSKTPITYRFDNNNDIIYQLNPGEIRVLHEHMLEEGQSVLEVHAAVNTYDECLVKAINIKDVSSRSPERLTRKSEVPNLINDEELEEGGIEEDNDDSASDE